MTVEIGVIGATGLVGQEMLRILEERAFPVGELRVYASPRSEGRRLAFAGGEVTCEVLRDGCFDGLDLVIVDVDDPLALEWAPVAAARPAQVIDNSAAFRMDPDVPLVVAEVNPEDLRDLPKGIASCPNCTTMVLVTALAPLHRAAGIERMVVSTYQSVSGAGCSGHGRARHAVEQVRGRLRVAPPRRHRRRLHRSGRRLVEADRRQRHPARRIGEGSGLHVRGVEARLREPQDPPRRRRCASPRRAYGSRSMSVTR